MRSGSLRHRVTIRQNTPSVDSGGEVSDSWSDVETVYAKVDPISGTEFLRADRTTANITHRITMRYRSDLGVSDTEVSPRYRLVYDERTFEPRRVVDLEERHRWIEVMAEEVV